MNRIINPILILSALVLLPAPATSQPLTNVTFVAFDLETTGFSPKSDRVIEIAAVKFRDGKVVETKSWLVNPGIKIPPPATGINRITNEMVAKSPAFSSVFPEFMSFITNGTLLAHNASFDIGFLTAETQRNNLIFQGNGIIDTLTLARKWFPESKAHDMESLVLHLGIKEGQGHRSLTDSLSLMKIFLAGIAKMPHETDLETLIKTSGFKRPESRAGKP